MRQTGASLAACALALAGAAATTAAGPAPAPASRPAAGSQAYTLAQATSDAAQLNTIAFDGLAFLTGSFQADTFLPPGKIADYFGFQDMRDVQPQGAGHNTDFLTRASNNVIAVLDTAQRAQLVALAEKQVAEVRDLALQRFTVISAFRRLLAGKAPAGSAGLSSTAVQQAVARIFALDGRIAWERALAYGSVIRSLSAAQQAKLAPLAFGDASTWPVIPEPIDKRTMSHDANVLVMSYGGDLLSWLKGSLDADVYFCPERHATYFGSFFLKDAPAMGQADFAISTSLTGDSGAAFLAALTPAQRARITSIVGTQRAALAQIVQARRAISTELRRLQTTASADQTLVLAQSERYGRLDGQLAALYATRFAEVGRSLTPAQRATLVRLRNLATVPAKPFLYSDPVEMPEIGSTDGLFARRAAA